jgi:hypothetical protein
LYALPTPPSLVVFPKLLAALPLIPSAVFLGLGPPLPLSALPIVVPLAALNVELAPAVPLALEPPAPPAVPTTNEYA